MPVVASSGSFLISPNVGLMIWTLLLFVISMYVLAKLAFPRISQALERRHDLRFVRGELSSAGEQTPPP